MWPGYVNVFGSDKKAFENVMCLYRDVRQAVMLGRMYMSWIGLIRTWESGEVHIGI